MQLFIQEEELDTSFWAAENRSEESTSTNRRLRSEGLRSFLFFTPEYKQPRKLLDQKQHEISHRCFPMRGIYN